MTDQPATKQLAGRVAIVTGASSGIGRAIAQAFAAEGATTVLAARDGARLEAAAAAMREAGGAALAIATDVTVEDEVAALFDRVLDRHGRVDVLVNNAGIIVGTPTESLALADWQRVIDVNLTGAFLCSRAAFRAMKPRGGRIINIGSTAAKVPRPHSAAYTTSKFALEGLTRSLALDGREHGIAVSILHPGNTASALWGGAEDEQRRREGVMSASEVARVAVVMAALPPDINLLEGLLLPVAMPFLGRG